MSEKTLSAFRVIGIATIAMGVLFSVLGVVSKLQPTEVRSREKVSFPVPVDAPETTILFVGDIMLGRAVERLSKQEGEAYPFTYVEQLLSSADLVVGNLEGPIPDVHIPTESFSFGFSFPPGTAELLAKNNIKMVSLGNNHALDQGRAGLLQTKERLRQSEVLFAGDPYILDDISIATTTFNDQQFVFIFINATYPSFKKEKAVELVGNTSINYPEGFRVVGIHWGTEYATTSSSAQQELARAFIDAGANLIVGHHPHVVQEMEEYKNAYIFYSLGNFIFDQYFSRDVQEGLAVKLISGKNISFELLPYGSARSQPRLLEGFEKEQWLSSFVFKVRPEIRGFIEEGVLSFPNLTN